MPTRRLSHRVLADQLAASGGILTWDAAQTAGARHALRACIADGSVVRVLPEIYAAGVHARTPAVRLAAASAWSSPGALTGVAAAHVWGVVDEAPEGVAVIMPPQIHRQRPNWLRILRTKAPQPIFTVGGLRVVDTHHAVVHAWNELPERARPGIVIAAVRRGTTTAAAMERASTNTPRVKERAKLHELLGFLEQGVTSYLEYVAKRAVFTEQRCPWLIWQVPILAGGRKRIVDIFDSEARIAIELDGREFHDGDALRRADLERDTALGSVGVQVLRFTYEDIVNRPRWCLAMYTAARAQRLYARSGQPPAAPSPNW